MLKSKKVLSWCTNPFRHFVEDYSIDHSVVVIDDIVTVTVNNVSIACYSNIVVLYFSCVLWMYTGCAPISCIRVIQLLVRIWQLPAETVIVPPCNAGALNHEGQDSILLVWKSSTHTSKEISKSNIEIEIAEISAGQVLNIKTQVLEQFANWGPVMS